MRETTTVKEWPWTDGPDVQWLRAANPCGAEPVGVVSTAGRDLVVFGLLDDWRAEEEALGCGGVLLGGEGPVLVMWNESGVRVLPPGRPALPWLVVEPEGELAEVLQELICGVPSRWCQEQSGAPSENNENDDADSPIEESEWNGAYLPIPVPQGAGAQYLIVAGRCSGSVVMRECAGISDDWWQDPADLEAADCVPEGCALPDGWNGIALGRTHPGHPAIVEEEAAGTTILCGEVAGDPVAEIVNGQLRRLGAPSKPTRELLIAQSTAQGRAELHPGATVIVSDADILREWGNTARPHRSLHHLSEGGDHVQVIDHGPLLPAPHNGDGAQTFHSATVVRRHQEDEPVTTPLWWTRGDDTPLQVGENRLAGRVVEGWYHPFSADPVDPLLLSLWRELTESD